MTEETFSDEILMRFADGELDPETVARIEQAMEIDDRLVTRVAMFIETRAQAQAALKPLLDEPVPEKLVAAVEQMVEAKRASEKAASVLPFGGGRMAGPPSRSQWLLPIAASLAAVVGALAGYWAAGTNERAQGGLWVAGVIRPALGQALETVESGKEIKLAGISDRFRAIATFRNNSQDLCREFEVDSQDRSTVMSVACRSGDEWRVSFAVVAPGDAGGYAPASSAEALDAYLSAIEAGAPMSAEEEVKALTEVRQKDQK
ncbi:MAG: anti-sigma factor [Mesorhizobium sp.]|uniref:Anti-sigma factor n=1 Tax=Mesorhizobium mediterraneum TaxID=43617 RepID=A0AB36RB26_9HYPH|nr:MULTISPECIES: anti-sigma factor [Mesorhizobium]PAQ01427.1 anti-sigma factor [Mesorhizobium mediterraneum]RUU43518.1 anti-sigma factor [Mesorhizobium sp. M6A.T.Ce.TU.002.03.1.1]RVB73059.1 anti-sigma factor [Mesorhizobium sp. M6A.T.Cr.TU.014.01.1.1]RWN43001.1 MAG: anti-sigma factor [Mesorhizobium sp.]RWP02059.1 MAG: anti-sigma factor [Mesorhizobium sp.]